MAMDMWWVEDEENPQIPAGVKTQRAPLAEGTVSTQSPAMRNAQQALQQVPQATPAPAVEEAAAKLLDGLDKNHQVLLQHLQAHTAQLSLLRKDVETVSKKCDALYRFLAAVTQPQEGQ